MSQDFKKENRTSISLDEGSGVCLKKETEYTQRILRACRKSQGWYLNETEFVVPGKLLPENKRILGDVLRESSCCKHRNIYFEDQRHSCLHQHRREWNHCLTWCGIFLHQRTCSRSNPHSFWSSLRKGAPFPQRCTWNFWKLVEHAVTEVYFKNQRKWYIQKEGVAMGLSMAVILPIYGSKALTKNCLKERHSSTSTAELPIGELQEKSNLAWLLQPIHRLLLPVS